MFLDKLKHTYRYYLYENKAPLNTHTHRLSRVDIIHCRYYILYNIIMLKYAACCIILHIELMLLYTVVNAELALRPENNFQISGKHR